MRRACYRFFRPPCDLSNFAILLPSPPDKVTGKREHDGVDMARVMNRMHPGRVLREEYMEPMQLDADILASALGIPRSRIEPILVDHEPLTSDLALRLARYFRTSPQFWLGLQTAYDLSIAQARFGAEIEARVQPLAA